MRKYKIVISSYTFLPDIGGVATNVFYLAQGLCEAGHDVSIITLSRGSLNDSYPFKVVRDPSWFEIALIYAKSDFVVLSNLSLRLAWILLFLKKPFALRHHSESVFRLSRHIVSPDFVRRLIYSQARINFFTSEYVAKVSGLENYSVIHPFANPKYISSDFADFSPSSRDGAIFVGRLVEEKGVKILLDNWAVIRSVLDVNLLKLIGDGEDRGVFEACVGDASLEGIQFLGRRSLEECANEMRKAKYCFVPSIWNEPFGAVALEALASGCIVIHSDRGGLPETTGGLGFEFDPSSRVSFESALSAARQKHDLISCDEDSLFEYRDRVRDWVSKFHPRCAADKLVSVFSEVI